MTHYSRHTYSARGAYTRDSDGYTARSTARRERTRPCCRANCGVNTHPPPPLGALRPYAYRRTFALCALVHTATRSSTLLLQAVWCSLSGMSLSWIFSSDRRARVQVRLAAAACRYGFMPRYLLAAARPPACPQRRPLALRH